MIDNTAASNIYSDSLPPLDRKTERAYLHLAKYSPNPVVKSKARDILVRSNIRFLGRMSHRWAAMLRLDPEDLAAEGRMCLLRAIDKYDMEKSEVKFLSFAVWDIKHAFQEVLRRAPVIRGGGRGRFNNLIISSLDEEIGGSDDGGDPMTLRDVIADELNPHGAIAGEDAVVARAKVRDLLEPLSAAGRSVVEKRFGICVSGDAEDVEPLSIIEIAEQHGVSPQAVGGLYIKTMRAMRSKLGNKTT